MPESRETRRTPARANLFTRRLRFRPAQVVKKQAHRFGRFRLGRSFALGQSKLGIGDLCQTKHGTPPWEATIPVPRSGRPPSRERRSNKRHPSMPKGSCSGARVPATAALNSSSTLQQPGPVPAPKGCPCAGCDGFAFGIPIIDRKVIGKHVGAVRPLLDRPGAFRRNAGKIGVIR